MRSRDWARAGSSPLPARKARRAHNVVARVPGGPFRKQGPGRRPRKRYACAWSAAIVGGRMGWEPWRVSDGLWGRVSPLLPVLERRYRYPGRKRVDDRRCLEGILFVLFSGLPWQAVPGDVGVSGVTCWRRLREWQQAGVWQQLLSLLLCELEQRGAVDSARLIVDASIAPAKKGAPDGAKPGGSRPYRNQAASDHRRRRAAAGRVRDRGQRQRLPPAAAAARPGRGLRQRRRSARRPRLRRPGGAGRDRASAACANGSRGATARARDAHATARHGNAPRSSAPSPGCRTCAASPPAGNDATTSTSPS